MNLNQYINECFGQGTELTLFSMRSGNLVTALAGGDQEAVEKAKQRFIEGSAGFYKDYNPPTDRKTTSRYVQGV